MGALTAEPRHEGRLTRGELAALVESQRELVAQAGGGGTWRRDKKGEWAYGGPKGRRQRVQPASLAGRDLKGLDLRRVALPWANLRACRGPGQNLTEADLTGCLLADADLSGATLRRARLEGALLERARLGGAKLLEVSADRAVFARADLSGASFRRARLRGADFSGATLTGCDFRDADIEGASFEGAWLVGARIDWGPLGFPGKERFRVQKVTLKKESEGPDYFSSGEFQVVDQSRGEVMARFSWALDEPFMTNKSYSGPEEVRISEDGSEAIARDASGAEERVLLSAAVRAVELDGVEISPETDIEALVRRIAVEGGPPNAKGERHSAGYFLTKLSRRLGKSPSAVRLNAAVASRLDDPDPRLRAAALRFYYYAPAAEGSERVLDLFRTQRELFSANYKGSSNGETLEGNLVDALSQLLLEETTSERAKDAARAEVLAPGQGGELLSALFKVDRDFVLGHAVEIAASADRRWQDLVYALYVSESEDVGKVAAQIVAAGVTSRAKVVEFVKSKHMTGYYAGLIESALAAKPGTRP
ncbi:MAG: pentapeptide repeat-containing protein [Vicinamibacteria bacterium]|nr:pentapeptide repeat-containing protein [Vicinamibacteria bacterium]